MVPISSASPGQTATATTAQTRLGESSRARETVPARAIAAPIASAPPRTNMTPSMVRRTNPLDSFSW